MATSQTPPDQLLDQFFFCALSRCVARAAEVAPVLTERYRDQYTRSVSGEAAGLLLSEAAAGYRMNPVEYSAVRLLALLLYQSSSDVAAEARRVVFDFQQAEAAGDTVSMEALATPALVASLAVRRSDPELSRALAGAAGQGRRERPAQPAATDSEGDRVVVALVDLVPGLEETAATFVWADNDGVVRAINVAAPQVPPTPQAPERCWLDNRLGPPVDLPLATDNAALLRRVWESRLRGVVARSLARSVGRAIAADQLGRSVTHGQGDPNAAVTRSAVNLLMASTERADLRSSALVPRLIYVGSAPASVAAGGQVRCGAPMQSRQFDSPVQRPVTLSLFSFRTTFGTTAHGQIESFDELRGGGGR